MYAPIMLMGHVPVCLQAFLSEGTARIGESLQGFRGPTLRQSGDFFQEYPFVESNPWGVLGLNYR